MARDSSPIDSLDELTAVPFHQRQLLIMTEPDAPQHDSPWWMAVEAGGLAGALPYYGVYLAYKQHQQSKLPAMRRVAPETLASVCSLPGHPRPKLVYAGHPNKGDSYFPLAQFHRFVFESKVNEAIRLLMSLGATSIKVESQCGYTSDVRANLSLLGPEGVGTVGLGGAAESSSRRSARFQGRFPGHNSPEVPDCLGFYRTEPTWLAVAEGRIKFGLKEFSLQISYQDDFGISPSISGTLESCGFEIGGKFFEHKNTVWTIAGEFKA